MSIEDVISYQKSLISGGDANNHNFEEQKQREKSFDRGQLRQR
jgi:hypothetical protein